MKVAKLCIAIISLVSIAEGVALILEGLRHKEEIKMYQAGMNEEAQFMHGLISCKYNSDQTVLLDRIQRYIMAQDGKLPIHLDGSDFYLGQ